MPLAPRSRLGVYEIVSPIGCGGMREVYSARDTRLALVVVRPVSKTQGCEVTMVLDWSSELPRADR